MKKIGMLIACSLILFSCKKNEVNVAEPDKPLQLPLGAVTGAETAALIGPGGGNLQSSDGNMRITIDPGTVDAATRFSIQPVKNTLGSPGPAYRLLPENTVFKKPVKLTYYYGGTDLKGTDPSMLFLACQDKNGFYYSADKTAGNRNSKTLSVHTTHFSDWTFYSKYSMYVPEDQLTNGKVILRETEKVKLVLNSYKPGKSNDDLSPLLQLTNDPVIIAAEWNYAPRKGALAVEQTAGIATYTAPATIPQQSELVVTATLNSNLGKDNEGNPVRQLQFVQPVVLSSGDYFILTEDGRDMNALQFSADAAPLVSVQAFAGFANGYNLSCFVYAGVNGSYSYDQHGAIGNAIIEMIPQNGNGYRSWRVTNCQQNNGILHSPGSLVLTSVATAPGEYTEGHFTVTLWQFNYCDGGGTKTLSGRFRIKKV